MRRRILPEAVRVIGVLKNTAQPLWTAMLGLTVSASAPWVPRGEVPLPRFATSVQITRAEEPLFIVPDGSSQKRGAAEQGALLPLFAAQRGPGCQGRWFLVGPLAWVCEAGARVSAEAALAADPPLAGQATKLAAARTVDGLPYRYHFVGKDGSFGYSDLLTAEDGVPEAQLLPGFGVALVAEGRKPSGDSYGLTSENLWVPLRDLAPARAPSFRGVDLDGVLNAAWIISERAYGYSKPAGTRVQDRTFKRLERVEVRETREVHGKRWLRVSDELWLSAADLRIPTLSAPPSEARAGERWIDVDLKNQVVTAYAGERPLFTTLVSTGRGREGSEQATPKGVHRIWVKLRSSNMDNLENEAAHENYAIQAVPWVMYFKRGFGLHGTFWHRRFGHVHSHGCVNLSPLDAERLFHFTSPRLPAGWSAAFPTDYEPGTIVRVR